MPRFLSPPRVPVFTSPPASAAEGAVAAVSSEPKRLIARIGGEWVDTGSGEHTHAPGDVGAAPASHTHAAADTTSGAFADARIPNLNASKVTAGIFDVARIPNLDVAKITSGEFPLARIPLITVANGGTGRTTLTAARYLRGNGTGAVIEDTYATVLSNIGAAPAAHDHGGILNPNTWAPGEFLTVDLNVGAGGSGSGMSFRRVADWEARMALGAAASTHTHTLAQISDLAAGGTVDRLSANLRYDSTSPSTFPDGISLQNTTLTSRGFPGTGIGVLETVRTSTSNVGQKFYDSAGTVWMRTSLSTSAWGNWSATEDTGWTSMSLQNGWSDYGAGYAPGRYRRVDGVVYLSGLIRNGTAALIATLPVGYRPGFRQMTLVHNSANTQVGRLDITTTGQVLAQTNLIGTSWCSMENVSFVADG